MTKVEPTLYQRRVLSIPENINVLLSGGRGGGKTHALLFLILRHIEKYGADARPLIVRETWKSLEEIMDALCALLTAAYGTKAVQFNRANGIFRLGNGAIVECGQLDGPTAYTKYQGRSFTFVAIDEFGLLGSERWVRLLVSNLRASEGVPLRVVYSANPGGRLHAHIHSKHVAAASSWEPYELDGARWINAPSTYVDNPHINQADYLRRLKAAAGNDEELLRAWASGDWNISRGAFFAGDLSESVHLISETWPYDLQGWRSFLSLDWGSAAPAVCFICLKAPEGYSIPGRGGEMFARGSLILLDEIAAYDPNDLNVGLRWPPAKLAEAIRERTSFWREKNHGVGDDAIGLDDTLLAVLRQSRIYLHRPDKKRIGGWAKLRNLMANAKERNGRPGFYATSRCKYFWKTAPFHPRDENRPEDLDTNGPDHALDGARYAAMELNRGQTRFWASPWSDAPYYVS